VEIFQKKVLFLCRQIEELKMMTKHKGLLAVVVAVALFIAIAVCWGFMLALAPNFKIQKTVYVYVDEAKDFSALCAQLDSTAHCRHLSSFKQLASLMHYPSKMHTGRYAVRAGMSNLKLLNDLRGGHQAVVKLSFNNIRTNKDLADCLSKQLMPSEEEFMTLFNDSVYCDSLGFTPATIGALFIPNTYEVYWNISARKLMNRMKKEYTAFWNGARLNKAREIGFTPVEISTLASIVEEETAAYDEYSLVAGVYINRIHTGMPLQADPTIKFALGDFSLRRILFEHLQVDSPYNTYKNVGLPPGPIRIPTIRGIDAVLNYVHHNYLYMCAKEDFSGRHNYAATMNEHVKNAARYREELNRRGIQ